MSFQERMLAAGVFEKQIIDRLNSAKSWSAFPFGQSQLPEECRKRLIRFEDSSKRPALIRWMPDVITFRDLPNGQSFVALIDAKTCPRDRPNYAIEMSAIETAEIYTDRLYTPTFFVFDDWKLLTPREARQRGTAGPTSNGGSGTPYLLVPKRFGKSFESVFTLIEVAS